MLFLGEKTGERKLAERRDISFLLLLFDDAVVVAVAVVVFNVVRPLLRERRVEAVTEDIAVVVAAACELRFLLLLL